MSMRQKHQLVQWMTCSWVHLESAPVSIRAVFQTVLFTETTESLSHG
jgi:hypothetical protein